jgi:hypothetical protein
VVAELFRQTIPKRRKEAFLGVEGGWECVRRIRPCVGRRLSLWAVPTCVNLLSLSS